MTQQNLYQTRLAHTTQRWLFVNNSAETVPAYGCMRIEGSFSNTGVPSKRDRVPTNKPDADAESAQDPARLMFNLGSPVAAGATGSGVLAYPAYALVDSDVDDVGYSVGPVRDSWSLKRGGVAFLIRGKKTINTTDYAYVDANTCRLANAVVKAGATAGSGSGSSIVATDFDADLLRRTSGLGHSVTGIVLKCMNDFTEVPAEGTFIKVSPEPNGKWSFVVWPC